MAGIVSKILGPTIRAFIKEIDRKGLVQRGGNLASIPVTVPAGKEREVKQIAKKHGGEFVVEEEYMGNVSGHVDFVYE